VRKDIVVEAASRATRGKNEAHRTRSAGQIPAVMYGSGQDPVAIAVDPKAISKIIRSASGFNTIFNLSITGGENSAVMVVDTQVDPIRGNLLHCDLKRIDLTKRIKVTIPVVVTGEAKGIKLQGGQLEIITRQVEIDTLPEEIPERYVVDVTELMVGQAKRASEIPMIGSGKLVSPGAAVIAHVVSLRPEAETAAPAAGAPEPEVVKKGKKEEEGEKKK
jgi:large subunit ribosomal protein L25